jgi:hypothetical protein
MGHPPLNDVANGGKHRAQIIKPTMFITPSMGIGMIGGEGNVECRIPPTWDSEKDEATLAVVRFGYKLQYDAQLTIDVTFNDVEFITGAPVLKVLQYWYSKVLAIVTQTELTATTLGLI